MSEQKPGIGRIVHYTLNQADAGTVNRQRGNLSGRCGNQASAGDVYPMIITRAWGDEPTSAVNGQVLLDGNDALWLTSVTVGEGERHFAWPVLTR